MSTNKSSAAVAQRLSMSERSLLLACAKIFQGTLSLSESELSRRIQAVKAALYDRNYALAFSTPENTQAYAARWVPSRALIYRRLFDRLELKFQHKQMILLGGGPGSELIALSSLATESSEDEPLQSIAIDSADWSACYQMYLAYFSDRPQIQATLQRVDIINATAFQRFLQDLPAPSGSQSRFFTLFFTLHELLLASRPKTVAMFRQLTDATSLGDQLLVVESASLGTVKLGEREYSLTWLLQHLLVSSGEWAMEDHASKDAEWFRLPLEEAQRVYPIKLENSRVLVRLFTRRS